MWTSCSLLESSPPPSTRSPCRSIPLLKLACSPPPGTPSSALQALGSACTSPCHGIHGSRSPLPVCEQLKGKDGVPVASVPPALGPAPGRRETKQMFAEKTRGWVTLHLNATSASSARGSLKTQHKHTMHTTLSLALVPHMRSLHVVQRTP